MEAFLGVILMGTLALCGWCFYQAHTTPESAALYIVLGCINAGSAISCAIGLAKS